MTIGHDGQLVELYIKYMSRNEFAREQYYVAVEDPQEAETVLREVKGCTDEVSNVVRSIPAKVFDFYGMKTGQVRHVLAP